MDIDAALGKLEKRGISKEQILNLRMLAGAIGELPTDLGEGPIERVGDLNAALLRARKKLEKRLSSLSSIFDIFKEPVSDFSAQFLALLAGLERQETNVEKQES